MSSITTTYDPDREKEPREVEDGKHWAALRNHTQQWITATGETWELDPFAGRWFLVEPERLRAASPRLTMDEFNAYKATCETQAAFTRDLMKKDGWLRVDHEIHDRDAVAERKYLDDLSWDQLHHPEDWA